MRGVAVVVWFVLVAYWGFIFYGTHLPAITIPLNATDKTAHYLAYGALGGLLYIALWVNNPRRMDVGFLVLLIGMVYGALDELTQPLGWFHRTCDFMDWCADAAGLATAVVIMTMVQRGWRLLRGRRAA